MATHFLRGVLIAFLALLAFLPSAVFALPGNPGAIGHSSLEEMRMVEKVARIQNGGQQLSFKEFGKLERPPQTEAEVAKDYQWLGRIRCGASGGTANVTVARDVITTAAHVFHDKDCIQKVPDLNKCIFIPAYARQNGSYDQALETDKFPIIASTLHVGTKCTTNDPLGPSHDWAVVRLSRPVPIERPAQVLDIPDDMDAKELTDYLKSAMIVTATNGNGNRPGYTQDDPAICPNGKSYEAYQDIKRNGAMELVHTCSAAPGDSGGSIAVRQLLPGGSTTDTRMIGVNARASTVEHNDTDFSVRGFVVAEKPLVPPAAATTGPAGLGLGN
jgi:hypothetical protein